MLVVAALHWLDPDNTNTTALHHILTWVLTRFEKHQNKATDTHKPSKGIDYSPGARTALALMVPNHVAVFDPWPTRRNTSLWVGINIKIAR